MWLESGRNPHGPTDLLYITPESGINYSENQHNFYCRDSHRWNLFLSGLCLLIHLSHLTLEIIYICPNMSGHGITFSCKGNELGELVCLKLNRLGSQIKYKFCCGTHLIIQKKSAMKSACVTCWFNCVFWCEFSWGFHLWHCNELNFHNK